ncbi:hypothetical protein [Neolewinella agarilytica]|uniref:hypothetical protein n=1 Tax=Neolewinella agarilytica TaxID=478744 RepID=UPI0023531799|nr:hypothetical protein [Neolewinella agarilytica]
MIPRLLCSLLLLSLCACFPEANEDPDRIGPSNSLQAWAENKRFWADKEGNPLLLLGTINQKNLSQSVDVIQQLKELQKAGGNYVCSQIDPFEGTRPEPFARNPLTGQFDLNAPDSLYWSNFHAFLRHAASLDMVVQLELPMADSTQTHELLYNVMAEQALSISQHYRNVLYSIRQLNDQASAPSSLSKLRQLAVRANGQAFTDKYPFRQALPSLPTAGTYTGPVHFSAVDGNDPYDVIKNFNLAAANGYAGLCYASSRSTFEMRGARLASIRAIRTVERYLRFRDLKPAPEVLIGKNAHAFTDDQGNFLFYMPTAGEINVRLPVEDQVPIRVVVVGYLGTQRSELLRPPYGNSFKLFTDEIRGGWMILKREE